MNTYLVQNTESERYYLHTTFKTLVIDSVFVMWGFSYRVIQENVVEL